MKLLKDENLTKSSKKLTIEVSAEEFDAALDKAFDKVIKTVKADGFRPGKMPKKMFIDRYGWESLYEEAVNFALNETYPKALDEAKVNPISSPKLDNLSNVEKGKSFTYEVSFEVMPEVELGEYKGLEVKQKAVRVTKKMVDERIDRTLKQKAENVIKEGPIAEGDIAIFDFVGSVDGVEFPGGKAENYELEIGSHSFIPGFEEQMVGMVAGEIKDIKVTFPTNYGQKDLAGKEANFNLTIHEVKQKEYPTLNDDFVAELDLEGITTVEQYQEHVKEEIKHQLKHEAEHAFENDLMKALLDKAVIEVPESVVSEEVNRAVKNVESQAKQYNMPVETLLQYQGIENMDRYKEMYAEYVRTDIKRELIFNEIAKRENIQIQPEEVENEYIKLADYSDKDDEKAKEEKLKHAKEHYSIYSVIGGLTSRKAFDIVKSNAKIIK